MNSFSNRIKQLVDHFSGGNNSLFAAKIGSSEANIRNYINGTEPRAGVLEAIANRFEVNCEWLLTGRGEMLKNTTSVSPPQETRDQELMDQLQKLSEEVNANRKGLSRLIKKDIQDDNVLIELANKVQELEQQLGQSGEGGLKKA